ncbi:Hsp70 family protein [Glycomyces sp. MUSA5-2]|uniref:Hsp70 family protein n=1 Tax=Glycomyces sp. MUSA5-2 TaxID=2053002 RepID=UPI00300A38D0
MPLTPRAAAVGVDLGSSTTTVSIRRISEPGTRDVRHSPTRAEATWSAPGDESALVGLAVPATWSATRRRAHAEAAAEVGFTPSFLVSEPEAAARHYAEVQGSGLDPAAQLLVYSLGDATCHIALVRRDGDRYTVAAAKSADGVGGRAFDRLLLDHLASRLRYSDPKYWSRLQIPGETAFRDEVLDEVRTAREHLSAHPSATVVLPGLGRDLRLTHEDADRCLAPVLLRTIGLAEDVLCDAGAVADDVAAALLVGGGSRTPLVASVLGHHLGIEPVVPDLPELAVAEGAALAGLARISIAAEAADPAPSWHGRLRTSSDVLATMLVVLFAMAAFAGVALLNRSGVDSDDIDADSPNLSVPNETGTAEPAAPSPPEGESAPVEPSEEDDTVAAPSEPPPTSQDPATFPPSASPVAEADAALPDAVGRTLADALALLADAGFTDVSAEGQRVTGNTDYANCEVTAQSPEPGSTQPLDAPVVLAYAYRGSDHC